MENAQIVHPRNRARDHRRDRNTRLDRNLRQPAPLGRPRRQVAAAIAIFEEEGRRVEIPFEQRGKRGRFAESGKEQAGQRRFAFQAAQPVGRVGEFEDARLAGHVMTRQPDVFGAAVAERFDEPPLPAAGDRVAGRKSKARRQRRLDAFDRNRRGELVSYPRHRLDNLLVRFAERFSSGLSSSVTA